MVWFGEPRLCAVSLLGVRDGERALWRGYALRGRRWRRRGFEMWEWLFCDGKAGAGVSEGVRRGEAEDGCWMRRRCFMDEEVG